MAPRKQANFRIVVIGASAGGLGPLMDIVRSLDPRLSAAVFVIIHTSASSAGLLPDLLSRAGPVPARRARHGDRVEPGRICVAPPDYHLVLQNGHMELNHGPRENGFRPAVDPLFRSAAATFGRRVVGIVLSGGMNDGTHGLRAIQHAGGVVVVQEPTEALNASMPLSAVRHAAPDHVLPARDIGPLINQLDRDGTPSRAKLPARAAPVPRKPAPRRPTTQESNAPGSVPAGTPTTLTCPECGGCLWKQASGTLLRYECRVGHAFTDRAYSKSNARRLEAALWTAARVLEESAAHLNNLAERARRGRLDAVADAYELRAHDAQERAAVILNVLSRPMPNGDPAAAPAPATPPAARGRRHPDNSTRAADPPEDPESRKSKRPGRKRG